MSSRHPTPQRLRNMPESLPRETRIEEEAMPEAFAELKRIAGALEAHYRDMQDIEFTVQEGKLFMLQRRGAKRTAKGGLKVAVDLVREGRSAKTTRLARRSLRHSTSCCIRHSIPACQGADAAWAAASPGEGNRVYGGRGQRRAAATGATLSWAGLKRAPRTFTAVHGPRAS